MARAKFRASYKGIGEILRSAQMQREMEARAERVKAAGEAIAPVDTGTYAASFRVESGVREGKTKRAVATVINDAPHATLVEWGTSKTPRHRVMGQAAGAE